MSDDKDKRNQNLYDNLEEDMFVLAINKAAEIEGKMFLEEAEQLNNNPEYQPSEEAREKFIKLLDRQLKLNKRKKAGFHSRKLLKRGLITLAAVIAVFTIAMCSVSAFRRQVFNFVIGVTEKYTSFQLQDNQGNASSDHMIVDWKNSYVPTYMPDGYVASDIYNTDNMKSITFKNNGDDSSDIVYMEYAAPTNLELDTENASTVKTIKINGKTGTLIIKNNVVTLAWELDKKIYTVTGQVDSEQIIKIAENVKFIK